MPDFLHISHVESLFPHDIMPCGEFLQMTIYHVEQILHIQFGRVWIPSPPPPRISPALGHFPQWLHRSPRRTSVLLSQLRTLSALPPRLPTAASIQIIRWRGAHWRNLLLSTGEESIEQGTNCINCSSHEKNVSPLFLRLPGGHIYLRWGAFDYIRQKRKQGYNMMLQIMEMMVDSLMQSDQLTLSLIRIPVSVGLIIPGSVPTFKILW